jgi:hypothetical protein
LDTAQCHLQFLAVENISIEQWRPPLTARIEVARRREDRRIHIDVNGDGMSMKFDCSDSILVGHISAFKLDPDGSDGGPRLFASRIDARRYDSLPETYEKTYYGRI